VLCLKNHISLNETLLLRAFKVHDLGEVLTKRDVLVQNKIDHLDLEEYLVFVDAFSHLRKEVFYQFKLAFLLQFARKNPNCFPEDTRIAMKYLTENFMYEAIVFEALESWEYIFYPLKAFQNGTDKLLLTRFLKNQIPRLQKFAEELPGFREEVFTRKFETWAVSHIRTYPV